MTGGSDFYDGHDTLPVRASPDERARATAYLTRVAPDLLAMLGLDDAPSTPSTGSRTADYARRARSHRSDAQRGTQT